MCQTLISNWRSIPALFIFTIKYLHPWTFSTFNIWVFSSSSFFFLIKKKVFLAINRTLKWVTLAGSYNRKLAAIPVSNNSEMAGNGGQVFEDEESLSSGTRIRPLTSTPMQVSLYIYIFSHFCPLSPLFIELESFKFEGNVVHLLGFSCFAGQRNGKWMEERSKPLLLWEIGWVWMIFFP